MWRNGLNVAWDSSKSKAAIVSSHPEMAVALVSLSYKVTTSTWQDRKRALGRVALPLVAMRAGVRCATLRVSTPYALRRLRPRRGC